MRMRTASFLVSLFAAALVVSGLVVAEWAGAVGTVRWDHRAGLDVYDVAIDGRGNVYATGTTKNYGMLLARYRPGGTLRWKVTWRPAVTPQTVGGAAYAHGTAVAVQPHGDVFVAGQVASGCEGSGWFIARYTRGGKLVWRREVPGWRKCWVSQSLSDIAVRGGRLVVTGGQVGCCGEALADAWVRSYTTSGRRVWTTDFEVPSITGTHDWANAVALDARGRAYAVGRVEMTPRDDVTELVDHEAVVMKLSRTGRVLWTRMIRDKGVEDMDRAIDVAVRGRRVVVLAQMDGTADPSSGRSWLARFSSAGKILWKRRWSSDGGGSAAVAISTFGRIFVSGIEEGLDGRSDVSVRGLDREGRLDWELSFDHGQRQAWGAGIAHGDGKLYVGSHTERKLGGWVSRIEA